MCTCAFDAFKIYFLEHFSNGFSLTTCFIPNQICLFLPTKTTSSEQRTPEKKPPLTICPNSSHVPHMQIEQLVRFDASHLVNVNKFSLPQASIYYPQNKKKILPIILSAFRLRFSPYVHSQNKLNSFVISSKHLRKKQKKKTNQPNKQTTIIPFIGWNTRNIFFEILSKNHHLSTFFYSFLHFEISFIFTLPRSTVCPLSKIVKKKYINNQEK